MQAKLCRRDFFPVFSRLLLLFLYPKYDIFLLLTYVPFAIQYKQNNPASNLIISNSLLPFSKAGVMDSSSPPVYGAFSLPMDQGRNYLDRALILAGFSGTVSMHLFCASCNYLIGKCVFLYASLLLPGQEITWSPVDINSFL